MRQFALVDSSNNRFELTIARASFFNQPTGLGFARDNEYVRVGGAVLALKGAAAREELAEAQNAIRKLGLKVEEVKEFPVDGAMHAVIVL